MSTSGSRLVSCSSEGTIIWGVQANRITLLCSCYVPTFSAAPLCLDSDDDSILQVFILYFMFMHSTFTSVTPFREMKPVFAALGRLT